MAQDAENDTTPVAGGRRRSFWRRWVVYPLLVILVAAFIAFWIQRKDIADNVIGGYLRSHNVEATYHIDQIGGTRQVLTNIIVGDPKHPNLTVERAEVVVRYRFGLPGIARIILTRPRLRGTYRDGKFSLGALDPLVFTGSTAPFEFPDLSLDVDDARALIETDYGRVGIKAAGKGYLRGGFAGIVAATAPELALGGCKFAGSTLYGKVGIDAERPTFDGPLRLTSLDCGDGATQLTKASLQAKFMLDRDLAGIEGTFAGETHSASHGETTADTLRINGKAAFRDGGLTANYKLAGEGLAHPQAQVAALNAEGTVRAGDKFGWLRAESAITGTGFRPGAGLDKALEQAAAGSSDTLVGAVLRKLRGALMREANGSTLSAQASLNRTGSVTSLVIPQASVTGGSGERVLSLSRFQYGDSGGGLPRLSGNVATGGRDLPRIEGRVEQRGSDGFTAKLAMATYHAEGSSIAIPSFAVASKGQRIGFSGRTILTGDLPGGHAEGLLLPVSGNWSDATGLAVWRQCTKLVFDSLRVANLTLERHGLTVCPAAGLPIVSYGKAGLRVAAGMPSLDVAGRLGETPIAIRSGAIGFAYPGAVSARQLLVSLGPSDTAANFAIQDLSAEIGKNIAGHFDGTDVKLSAVPLDIIGASGAWDYTDGKLAISDGAFRLVDRQATARFEPMVARGATLSLVDNIVTANALLREPKSDAEVSRVAIHHDLATGRGHADLAVDGITFNGKLQPDQLSQLSKGVIALAKGTVTGSGQIDWDEKGVTSSGKFSSDSLDFAAAFGPVEGASGTVVFSDLLALTTAPDQRLKVASINPGIEVYDGEVGIQLTNGEVLQVTYGKWPFMGGTLSMRPVTLNLGVGEQRAYILDIQGLEAAQFVQRMELENISATGTFDGEMPLIFDEAGNGRIEGGRLVSRGGGNLSYVGALTYKDLSPMANMAFDALRSLDYSRMTVGMDGPLTGDIVTRVRFDGVSQGKGASKNFITRRIGKLPFRFIVNVRAPFYKLITSIRAMYDPTMIRDPRELGLIDAHGNAISQQPPAPEPTPAAPTGNTPDEAVIQRPESEDTP